MTVIVIGLLVLPVIGHVALSLAPGYASCIVIGVSQPGGNSHSGWQLLRDEDGGWFYPRPPDLWADMWY